MIKVCISLTESRVFFLLTDQEFQGSIFQLVSPSGKNSLRLGVCRKNDVVCFLVIREMTREARWTEWSA